MAIYPERRKVGNVTLLDTCALIDLLRRRSPRLAIWMANQPYGEIAVSAITLAELEAGPDQSADPEKNRKALRVLVNTIQTLPFDVPAAEAYGLIFPLLKSRGELIGAYDLLIAAHAVSLNAILITSNVRHFARVPGLVVQGTDDIMLP